MCRAPDLKASDGASSPRSVATQLRAQSDDNLWKIHGRQYDLTPFLRSHPGGTQVLISVRGEDDLTAIFESNHAFADRARIERIMSKFYVGDCEPTTFAAPDGGFYNTVRARVRAALPHGGRVATRWWCVKTALLTAAWALSACLAFFGAAPFHLLGGGSGHDAAPALSLGARCVAALVAGHLFISVGFVVMHDASHSAISATPHWNTNLSWLWNAIACWDHRLWHKHHVFRHHSFTGDLTRDPDAIHLTPFLRKHAADRKRPLPLSRRLPWAMTVLFVNLLPGMFLGQAISYARWWQRGRLWRMQALRGADVDWAACVIRTMMVLLYLRHPLIAITYLLSKNCTYAVCILPDHDTEETRVAAETLSTDWGEEQVRNSANFATSNPLVGALYGGINFQIEHHLFPTLCHVHYTTIQPIVRKTCHEFGIPYVDHPTVGSAYVSALKAIATATCA